MLKFAMRVRAWESLLQAKFYENRLRGYTHFGKIYTKNYQFWRFWRLQTHIFKATTVKFGVRLQTWDTLPAPTFVTRSSAVADRPREASCH